MDTTDIVKRYKIVEVVANYDAARLKLAEGLSLLSDAGTHAHGAFGDYTEHGPRVDEADFYDAKLHKSAWRWFFNQSGVKDWLSISRYDGLEHKIDDGEMPAFTVEAVEKIAADFMQSAPQLLDESVAEVFEWLRPPTSGWQAGQYKTNKLFEVGRKLIKDWVIDTSFGMVRICYSCEKNLQALDNAFSMLDGKGVSRYPGGLLTAIRQAITDREWECETDYFRCKWYKKGSWHLEFKRLDLLRQLNKIGGKGKAQLTHVA